MCILRHSAHGQFKCDLFSDMDGCTDDRSLTPPLPKNLIASNFGENGKQIISSLYDKDDQVDINRSTPMSAIANKL